MTQQEIDPEQVDLDAHIADLGRLVDTVPSGDKPMVAGLLGELLLERYDLAGQEVDLHAGLARLHAASAAAPAHPDTPLWCYLLGAAYGARASGTSPGDWDTAIGWMTKALTGAPHDDLDPDAVTADLAQLYVRRFYALAPELDPAAAEDAADRLVASLTELTVSVPDSTAGNVVAMLRGMALLARHDIGGRNDDRDDAIELLGAVLPVVSPDIGFLAGAWSDLADAHYDRFVTKDDRVSLDLSIRAADCALRLTDADELLGMMLRRDLAERLDTRWRLARATTDRDQAIEYLADFLASESCELSIWHMYGDLLRERGDTNNDASDLATAISWLRRAAEATPLDEDDAWLPWHSLGHAHLRRWDIIGDVADRDQLIACFGVSLDCGVPDAGLVLAAHQATVRAVYDQVERTPDAARRSAGIEARRPFDRAYRALEESAHAEPEQAAELALILAYAEVAVLRDPADIDLARVRRLRSWVHGHPDPPPGWTGAVDGVEGLVTFMEQAMSGSAGDYGLGWFVKACRDGAFAGELGKFFGGLAGLSVLFRGNDTGDRAMLQAAGQVLSEQGQAIDDPELELMAAIAEMIRVHSRGDLTETRKAVREALDLASALPVSPITENLVPYLTWMSWMCAAGSAEPADMIRSVDQSVFTGDATSFFTPMLQLAEVGAAATAAVVARDANGLRAALYRIDEIGRPIGPDHPLKPAFVGLLGTVSLQLAQWHPWDTATVDAALRWNTDTLSFWSGGEDPLFITTALNLAQAHRLRGRAEDLVRSRELGLAALRGHAYQVLLQSGTDHAVDAARGAAADAYRVAGWCAADLATDSSAADDLVHALDAGRGLVLHAATTSATVADQLSTLGHPGLAAEWTSTGGTERIAIGGLPGVAERQVDVPGDLRLRVLQALSGAQHAGLADERTDLDAAARMLAPPSVAEIRAALRAHGSDALVYLVSASTVCPGMAVLIPVDGPIAVLPMPKLEVGPDSPVLAYAAAYQKFQDTTDAERDSACSEWQVALRALGDWAWESAGRELLAASAQRCAGPVPRLILAPVGILAMVPWHAATRRDAVGVRYLTQDAVISSIPSARLLCDVVDRPACGDGDSLILGNPTGDLQSAGSEAQVIHRTFYPSGRHLGTTGLKKDGSWRPARDGIGTVEELLGWLADETRPRWMLHLACHAWTDPKHPTRSVLKLARGRASVATLLDRWPATRLRLGTVVLSGCTTDVAGESYDEAFSLATTFLALGARSTFGSLWLVDDLHATLFMFMFHHFLTTKKCAPADALHQTRLWMLDSNRRAPNTLPAELAIRFRSLTPEDPPYWAGFNHLGV